jgi:hypothetical protein
MKTKKKNQVAQGLDKIQLAITNTLAEPEILSVMTEHGYGTVALTAGNALCATAVAKSNRTVSLAGARKAMTLQVRDTRKALRQSVNKFSKVCRTLFRNDEGVLVKLGLKGKGPMPHADADFIDRARILFNTTEYTAAMKTKLATRKYDDGKLSAERAKIEAFDLARNQSTAAKGAQRQATQEKKTAVKAAKDWYRDLRATAKTELLDKPQLLEKIGIVVRDGKTKAQREAPLKAAETRQKKKVTSIAA